MKTTIIKLIILLISLSSFSQVKYGVKGGLNLADLSQGVTFSGQFTNQSTTVVLDGSNPVSTSLTSVSNFSKTITINTTPKISFYFGGYLEYPINLKNNLFLKAEIIYVQNGTNVDDKAKKEINETISYAVSGGKLSIGQINMPVLLKYTTNKKISILGGCYLGRILNAKSYDKNGNSESIMSSIKKYDFGLQLGVSYQLKSNIAIELRYNRGLTNLSSIKINDGFFNAESFVYNRTIHLGLEYQFN